MLVAGHRAAYPRLVKNLFSQTVFLCFSFKVITVNGFLSFFYPHLLLSWKMRLSAEKFQFSCSVLCTKQSMRVCSPVKLSWRLYIQRKMFLFDTGIFYTSLFSWKLFLIYILLWPSVAVIKTFFLLFSASVFCNYSHRKDLDCSFPGQQQKPCTSPVKEEFGRLYAGT